jgi:hypothetical protein
VDAFKTMNLFKQVLEIGIMEACGLQPTYVPVSVFVHVI